MIEFKDIINYPNYQITNEGKVFNKKRKKFLNPIKRADGYFQVGLYNNRTYKVFLLHILVAKYFLGELKKGFDVHHKNGHKDDNNVENLKIIPKTEHYSYHKTGINNPNYGKKRSLQSRKKQSETRKEKNIPPAHLGHHHSQQTKKIISKKLMGHKRSKQSIEKQIQTRNNNNK